MATGPLDLLLGDASLGALRERLELDAGRERSLDRVLLDTFDGRLREAGLSAELDAGRGGRATLTLAEPGAPPRRAEVERGPRHLVEELPRGPVRDRLRGVLEERALLPLVRVRSAVQPLAVLNGDAKTVVRLAIERPEVVTDGARVPLAARLSVRPVLGYDRDHERALGVLRDGLGLAPAGQALFDEAVLAAGGRPEGVSSKPGIELAAGTRAGEAASVVLSRLHEIAVANVPGTIEDLDTEFLHDLRVSIRRARSVLRELKAVHDPRERARVRDQLKWAQQLTGPMRDLDVQLLEWDQLVAPLPPERAAELEPLRALLARRRAREVTALRRGLRSKRFERTLAAWAELAAGPGGGEDADQPIEVLAGERIRTVYRRMVRDGSRIDEDSHPEALHDLRKRGKELRYLLELFGAPFPRKVVKPMVSTLKDLQSVLGRYQDRAVQTATLRAARDELAAEPGGPAALIALGAALDALTADQEAARHEFAACFERFAGAGQRKLVSDAFPKRQRV